MINKINTSSRANISGYTIIEVMIVLAVSGVMFLLAASFVNGKQQTTSFNQGAHEMNARIQDVIDQVSNGQYSDVPFTCDTTHGTSLFFGSSSSGASAGSPSSTSTDAGNQNCTYLGKVIQFKVGGDGTAYEVFTMAGARVLANTLITDYSDAEATPVDNSATSNTVNLTVQNGVAGGLRVEKITVYSGPNNVCSADYAPPSPSPSGCALGFMQSFGVIKDSVTHTNYVSSAQILQLMYAPVLAADGETAAALAITSQPMAVPMQHADNATICLTDGDRYATIKIGQNNNSQSATVTVLGAGVTACP